MDSLALVRTALAGRYEIEREIGRGGMATVYLARDVRHQRQVALKLLNPELGVVLGADRFLSEIRVTANLQHPNLLPLFDSGEADGLLFYVMPYVEGGSLRARLDREKQLPIDDAVHIAAAVAGALDYAHRSGIIHRDLKPENILLHDGEPMVADFGIALAVSNAGGARITQSGISLGTPRYMSPEQATSDRAIDGRTDIYSLGAVTYEMLSGEAPNAAATAQATIAKLMTEDPRPLGVVRRAVPAHVDAAVRRALEKLPADRFGTARDFAEALQGTGSRVHPLSAARARSRPRVVAAAWVAATVAVVSGLSWGWTTVRRGSAPAPVRLKVDLPAGQRFDDGEGVSVAIAPDGRTIAYLARGDQSPRSIFVRRMDELQSRLLPGTENAQHLSFSRDGQRLSFRSDGDRLNQIPLAGGSPSLIALVTRWEGNVWGVNNEVVFSSEGSIWHLRAPGETQAKIASPDVAKGQFDFSGPFVMPDGDHILYDVASSGVGGAAARSLDGANALGIASLSSGTRGTIERTDGSSKGDLVNASPLGYADGWLIYGRPNQTIAAIRLDPRRARTTGEPVTLVEGVFWKINGGIDAALSASGSLIYRGGGGDSFLSLLDSSGVELATAGEPRSYWAPVWAPDGRRLAVEVHTLSSAIASSIYVFDVSSGAFSRVTSRVTAEHPSWTADGKRIAFVNSDDPKQATIWEVPADGSGPEAPFFALPGRPLREIIFSPDDRYAVMRANPGVGDSTARLWKLPLHGDGKAVPFLLPFNAGDAAVSPDSKWIAYESDATGPIEIYVRAESGRGGIIKVSSGGGREPRWLADGRIVYRGRRAFRSATLGAVGGEVGIVRRDSLFADSYRKDDFVNRQNYDIARDGRFVLTREPSTSADIIVVVNWLTEVREQLRRK